MRSSFQSDINQLHIINQLQAQQVDGKLQAVATTMVQPQPTTIVPLSSHLSSCSSQLPVYDDQLRGREVSQSIGTATTDRREKQDKKDKKDKRRGDTPPITMASSLPAPQVRKAPLSDSTLQLRIETLVVVVMVILVVVAAATMTTPATKTNQLIWHLVLNNLGDDVVIQAMMVMEIPLLLALMMDNQNVTGTEETEAMVDPAVPQGTREAKPDITKLWSFPNTRKLIVSVSSLAATQA